MNKLYKVEDIVKKALEEVPEARDDDFILVAEVYNRIKPNIGLHSFNQIMLAHKELKLPYFESISRARRKLQAMYEDLKPSKEVEDARINETATYIDYAIVRRKK